MTSQAQAGANFVPTLHPQTAVMEQTSTTVGLSVRTPASMNPTFLPALSLPSTLPVKWLSGASLSCSTHQHGKISGQSVIGTCTLVAQGLYSVPL